MRVECAWLTRAFFLVISSALLAAELCNGEPKIVSFKVEVLGRAKMSKPEIVDMLVQVRQFSTKNALISVFSISDC